MRRTYDFPADSSSYETLTQDERRKNKHSIHSVPYYVGIIILLFLLGLYVVVYLVDGILPTPLTLADEEHQPDAFIAERARHDLKLLTDLGPRIVGGYENEVLAVDFLKREIGFTIQQAHPNQEIEMDVQVVSGCHYFNTRPVGKLSAYSNVQNIIVKLHSQNSSNYSVLVNSHFDSVPTSPGGSDDGINCAVMLEVLRKLAWKSTRPLHNIIFLFNGAEETGLQAAHGFITQHKWAKECKVVVNLEATGAGGKIILFQTGPGAAWLLNYYNKVPHPYGQAAGEEIFQSKILPSDTDFRIFSDYGDVVGFDMAFLKNGYRYHTKYDDFEHIPTGSYQHVGDNTLSLVTNLANAPELSQPIDRSSKIVYFDFLGLFMISYTQLTGSIINYITVALSVAMFLTCIYILKLGHTKQTVTFLVLSLGAIVGGWILAALFVSLTAFVVDATGFSMRWYAKTWLIIGLYVVPTIAVSSCLFPLINHENLTCNIKSHIQAHLTRLIWTFILLIGTVLKIRAMYALLIPVMFNTIAFIIIYVFKLQHTIRRWQVVYLVFNIIPAVFLMYTALTTLSLFIPMTGRIGSDKNADLIIGAMSLLFTILITSPFVALVALLRNFKVFLACLGAVFLLTLILALSPLGFPYSADPDSPAAQRYWIIHSRRIFHSKNGTEIKRDAGYFLLNMDRNSPSIVRPYVKELSKEKSLEPDCKEFLLCGLPLAHSRMIQIMEFSTWIPAGQPLIPESTKLEVLSKTRISPSTVRYSVLISGPDHMAVYLSPRAWTSPLNISLINGIPPADNTAVVNSRLVYFILHTYGSSAAPLNFTFEIEAPTEYEVTTEVAVCGLFVHDVKNRKVPHYAQFLNQFPKWADLTAWMNIFLFSLYLSLKKL